MHRRCFLGGAVAAALGVAARAQETPRLNGRLERGHMEVRDRDRPLLTYRHVPVEGPPGTDPLFTRSGYLHPVHAPNGAVVTDDFAPDHPHQRGVFFAWVKTRLELGGEELHPDFWNLGSGTGRIRSARVQGTGQDDLPFRLTTQHRWQARRGQEWEDVLAEVWEVLVHPPASRDPEAPDAAWVLDLTSRQMPAVDLVLERHRYGGMAIRGAREWLDAASGFRVLTSEGKDRAAADTSHARWVGMSGRVGGREAGIALLEHPGNVRAPNRLRVHPEVPYFVFAVPQAEPLTLRAGKEHVFRYRVVVHNGRTDPDHLDALWREFAGQGK